MKVTRILVLVVALGAGILAAVLIAGLGNNNNDDKNKTANTNSMEQVLVAKADIPLGAKVNGGQLGWQAWPSAALTDQYIRKSSRPNAINKLNGSIARTPFLVGEPIYDGKLIQSDRGFMAAILPKGMRAVAVEVKAPPRRADSFFPMTGSTFC